MAPIRAVSLTCFLVPLLGQPLLPTRDGTVSLLPVRTQEMAFSPTSVRRAVLKSEPLTVLVVVGTLSPGG